MDTVTLSFVGDIHAGRRSTEAFASDPAFLDAPAALLRRADVSFANLEGPLLRDGNPLFSSGVRLQASPEAAAILRHLGIHIVGLANNHTSDYGPEGVVSTQETLRAGGVEWVGAGRTELEARSPVVVTVRGQRIGFLATCDDEGGAAGPHRPGVWVIQRRALLAAVQDLRTRSDVVVVSIHTGIELSPCPEPYFVRLARQLVDAGATLVVGHHPHVPQGIERHGKGLIAYSLGNFLFDTPAGSVAHLTARQRQFHDLHPILETDVRDGAVEDFRVHWLTRREDGWYVPVEGESTLDVAREFLALCAVLANPAEYRRQVDTVYRAEFTEMAYYLPIEFCRSLYRGGFRTLKSFLFFLGTLRREPKRRRLRVGFVSWVRLLCARRPAAS
jgi:poly-gamma-glutamate capsule biosynthesis protein CapA/YwtB (metallophosphatase superfamily)